MWLADSAECQDAAANRDESDKRQPPKILIADKKGRHKRGCRSQEGLGSEAEARRPREMLALSGADS